MQQCQCGVVVHGHWHRYSWAFLQQVAAEMVAGNEEFVVETQLVHARTFRRHIGIQVDFGTAHFLGLYCDRIEQGLRMAVAAVAFLGDQIIDVDVTAPNQIVG